jgi:hypothetical protein
MTIPSLYEGNLMFHLSSNVYIIKVLYLVKIM